MAGTHHERLSAMDAMFLEIEDASLHMHIGAVVLFEAAPLLREDGGLDMDRIHAFAEAQLHKSPRLRQRLTRIPAFDHPAWVDDAHFNLNYHIRHTALPRPGGVRELKRLAGRILSQQLDRGKPLWEIWFIEGLEAGRFAVLTKLHHCMGDGVSSRSLLNMLMGTRPDYEPEPAPARIPREPPDGTRMVFDELAHRVTGPLSLVGGRWRAGGSDGDPGSEDLLAFVRDAARGAWRAAMVGLRPASDTPLNAEIGPHRRFDWTRLPLGEVKRVAHAAGGTVNDVVLAVVAGAVRSFLGHRGGGVEGIGFRVAMPVSVRTDADRGQLGNRVSSLIAELPIDEPEPWARLCRVVEMTRDLKRSGETQTIDLAGRLADWLPLGVMSRISQAGSQVVNMIVTNVPGPQVPMYMLGARMLESYPVVPLMANEALNIAIFSYDGSLFWGFNADWDALPDLHGFVEAVPANFEALCAAAPPG
jgi:WS/DGAT/MGAT family acyltransferase